MNILKRTMRILLVVIMVITMFTFGPVIVRADDTVLAEDTVSADGIESTDSLDSDDTEENTIRAHDDEDMGIPYVMRSWDAETKTVKESTEYVQNYIDLASTEISDNWYTVTGRVDLSKRLIVKGEVNLILCDNSYLYCKDGICVSEGNTLNIYCQKGETGTLYCDADTNDNAAIGADNEAGDCGTINIYGGNITADTETDGRDGAGIGGGDEGGGGTVTIYGGTVTAIGGKYGAGIGGGDKDSGSGNGGTTIIYGGTVTAKGGTDAAGIGGGEGGNGGLVEIWGGTVNATGNDYGAAIGNGEDGNGGTIRIYGGVTTAIGNKNAAAIGCRTDRGAGVYTAVFGDVRVYSGDSAEEAILQKEFDRVERCSYGYARVEPCTQHEFYEQRTKIDNKETHSYRCMNCDFTDEEHTFPHDLKANSWKWSEDYKNATVNVSCSGCHYSDDISIPAGQISDEIKDEQADEHTFTATFIFNGKEYTDTQVKCRARYTEPNGSKHDGYFNRFTSDTKELEGGWYVVKNDISIADRIICKGDVNLILKDGVELKAPKGISVNEGNSLTIWGDSKATGKLIVDSVEEKFSGIGGDKDNSSGQITINGGNIKVKGGSDAAGIGGGSNGKGNVTINGGTVDAEGGTFRQTYFDVLDYHDDDCRSGAGIGGGFRGEGVVIIGGGTIKAKGGLGAAGIGGGKHGTGNVTINGGTVDAEGASLSISYGYNGGTSNVTFGGAGIGGGEKADVSRVTINGGDITARGGASGAGIGSGGYHYRRIVDDINNKCEVVINGGSVVAKGGSQAAGIGGGNGERCLGETTITGGKVIAQGGEKAAAIGGGCGNKGIVTITGGYITATSGGIGSSWNHDYYRERTRGSVTLGYGDEGAVIYSSDYHNADLTLTKDFTDGTTTFKKKEYGRDVEDMFKEKTLYSTGAASTDIFVGHTLSLAGDIGLVYYLDISDKEAADKSLDFNWSYLDGSESKKKTYSCKLEKDKETGLYVAMCPVSAAEMVYGIKASITIDGMIYTDIYSVALYADTILTDKDFANSYIASENAKGNNGKERLEQLRTLVKAMLDYGSWAQVYFDRAPDLLINSILVTNDSYSPYYYAPKDVTADMINTGSGKMHVGLNAYGLEYTGSTLVYLSESTLRHYYKITDQAKFDAVKDKVTFNGQPVTHGVKDDVIYFELKDIGADELDTLFTLKIGSNEYPYSVLDYVKECLTSDTTPESLKNLAKATYRYNQAANVFFDTKASTAKGSSSENGSVKAMSVGTTETQKVSVQSIKIFFAQATADVQGIDRDEYETLLLAAKASTADINTCIVSGLQKKTYTGKKLTQNLIIKDGTCTLLGGTDYKIVYANNVNAGTAKVTITGIGFYTGTKTVTFKIAKAANPIKVTAKKKVNAKASKKTVIKKAVKVKKAKGKVTYKTNNKKVIVKKGKIIVAKGLKKGKTYKIKIKVTAKGNKNYKKKTKTVQLKVKVK